jgi:hypothetical protein
MSDVSVGRNNSTNGYVKNNPSSSNVNKSDNIKNISSEKVNVVKDNVSVTNFGNKNIKPTLIINLVDNNKDIITPKNYKEKIESRINDLHDNLKVNTKITNKQITDIKNFDPMRRDIFIKCIDELESLKSKKIKASDYMINVMNHAVNISGNNNEKFVELVGEVFSSVPIPLDTFRKVLGAGPHSGGNVLEPMLDKIIENQGGSLGFNSNITDDISDINNMTHHVGEFLQVGFNRGSFVGKLATDAIDRNLTFGLIQDKVNEGDIRSGYFSVMVGDALNDNKIKPNDAVKLFKWAYTTDHGGKEQPIFGGKETSGDNMNWNDYKIENWIKSYNKAFPNNIIKNH